MSDLDADARVASPDELDRRRAISHRKRRKRDPLGLIYRIKFLGREAAIWLRVNYLRRIFKMDIGNGAKFSLGARLDKTNPRGVHIGSGTYVAFDAVIFSHDMTRLLHTDTYVGRNCFIGARSIVMAGITIGDECIVGSGSVVTKDVPSGCIVAGNPARIIRSGIRTRRFGILEDIYQDVIAREREEKAELTRAKRAARR